jgi:transcription antitermination factor NusG
MTGSLYERSGRVCFVVRTKTQQELWAAKNVRQQGEEPWLPRISHREVLFPGYLFVWSTGRWRFLRSTYGVLDIIMTGERPAMLPLSEIERIRAMEGDSGFVVLPPRPAFVPGQSVEVAEGLFMGEVGLCEGMLPNDRVRVLLEAMGQSVPVELDASQVVPYARPRRRS